MDFSSMSTLLSCPREYQESQVFRKAGDNESPATKFGTLWHTIMELHANGDPDPVAAALVRTTWTDDPTDYRTFAKAELAFQRWKETYDGKVWIVQSVEEPFSLALLPSCPESYDGRRDQIVDADSEEGKGIERWVVDFKTTSMLPYDWIQTFRISNQFKLYVAAARAVDPKIVGVCVDILHVTKGNKAGKTEGEREGVRLYRVFFRYKAEQIEEALVDFAAAVEMKEHFTRLGYWPRNTKNCRRFGHTCPFLDMCETGDRELRGRIRDALPANTFDPLRR